MTRNESFMLRTKFTGGPWVVIKRTKPATRRSAPGGRARSPQSQQEPEAIGYVDSDGVDRFNFRQTIWPYPTVRMRATPRFTRAAEVLSVNLLCLVLTQRDSQAFYSRRSRSAVRLARNFYEDCLSELPTEGWRIPLDTIREWLLHAQRK